MTLSPFVPLILVLKKSLKALKVIFEGIFIGLFLNFAWHYFLAVSLGWGDSAPDWYFRFQEAVFLLILTMGLIGWVLIGPRLDGYLKRGQT